MLQQLVVIQVALVAKLAQGMSAVRGVVGVPVDSVPGEVFARVPLALVCKDLREKRRVFGYES